MRLIKFIFCLLLCQLTMAQEAFVIKNVTLFDGDQIIKKTAVLVEEGKIQKVGRRIKGKYSSIDGTGKFLMPALINAHVHCWGQPQLLEAAQAGVLTLLDMHGIESLQPFLVEAGKQKDAARFYRAGFAATADGGHGTQYGFPVPTLDGPEDAAQWIKDRVKANVDYIKIIYEPWKNTHTTETVNALVKEAHLQNKMAVVHISNSEHAYESFQAGANGLVHIWRKGSLSDSQLNEMASKPFFITPTMLTNMVMTRLQGQQSDEEIAATESGLLLEIKRIYDAGIPLLAGTDPPNGNINMGTDLYKELMYFSKAGIPNIEVLKTATSIPAMYYKLEGLGSLKVGSIADMILLDKSPIENMSNLNTIQAVWKAGAVVIPFTM